MTSSGEEGIHIEVFRHTTVVCELLAIVCGDCMDRNLARTQQSDRDRGDRVFRFFVHSSHECVLRGPIHQRHDCSTVPFTDNCVGLPVADPHLFLHDGWALRMSNRPRIWTRPAWLPHFQFGFLPRRRRSNLTRIIHEPHDIPFWLLFPG